MTTMIEQVARAIVGPHKPVPAGSTYTLDQLRAVRWKRANSAERQNALNEARAAIEAMRDIDPHTAALVSVNWTLSPDQVGRLFRQAVDAALNEQVQS